MYFFQKTYLPKLLFFFTKSDNFHCFHNERINKNVQKIVKNSKDHGKSKKRGAIIGKTSVLGSTVPISKIYKVIFRENQKLGFGTLKITFGKKVTSKKSWCILSTLKFSLFESCCSSDKTIRDPLKKQQGWYDQRKFKESLNSITSL